MLVRLLAAAVVLAAVPFKVVATQAVAAPLFLAAMPAAASTVAPKIALKTQRSATWGLRPPGREEAGLTKVWSGHPA